MASLNQSQEYIFCNFHPHPDRPVSDAVFGVLDAAILAINQELAIDNADRHVAVSESFPDVPDVSISRYEGPDGLKVLSIGIRAEDLFLSFMARNDAGTKTDRWQNAASLTLMRHSMILDEEPQLTDADVAAFAVAVPERAQGYPFIKKRKTIFL